MIQQMRARITTGRALIVAALLIVALGLVIFPSRGSAQGDVEPDRTDQQSMFSIEDCHELEDTVFPEVEGLLAEIVDSGIVDQEQADGFYSFVSGIADTGCVAGAIMEPHDALTTIADLTNLTEEEVMRGIVEHGSLAEFANAHGASETELVDAVMERSEANAKALVESGEVDQETADKALALIEKLVTEGVNMSFDDDWQWPGDGWEMPDNGWQMPGQ